jgi:hypothetical protein
MGNGNTSQPKSPRTDDPNPDREPLGPPPRERTFPSQPSKPSNPSPRNPRNPPMEPRND